MDHLVNTGVLPRDRAPDSCIVNIYNNDDCIPPHVDHMSYPRPFCTMSLLSEAPIVLGIKLTPIDEGQFAGPVKVSLPRRSVLVLDGNSANVAKHCSKLDDLDVAIAPPCHALVDGLSSVPLRLPLSPFSPVGLRKARFYHIS